MPFKCVKKGNKYLCVTSDTGKVHGIHATKAECQKQLRALYANVPEARG